MTVGRSGRRDFGHDDDSETAYRSWPTGGYGELGDGAWEPEPTPRWRTAGRHSAAGDYHPDQTGSPRWRPDDPPAAAGAGWDGGDDYRPGRSRRRRLPEAGIDEPTAGYGGYGDYRADPYQGAWGGQEPGWPGSGRAASGVDAGAPDPGSRWRADDPIGDDPSRADGWTAGGPDVAAQWRTGEQRRLDATGEWRTGQPRPPDATGQWRRRSDATGEWRRFDAAEEPRRLDATGEWRTGSRPSRGTGAAADESWATGAWDTGRRGERRRYPEDGPEPAEVAAGAGPGDDAGRAKQRDRRKGLPLWQELPLLLIIAFCLAVLIRTFLMQAFFIPSGSMEDTLVAGDRVLVNKLVYHFREPARGEIVVFRGTDAWAPAGEVETDVGIFTRIGRTLGDLVGISHPGEKDYIKRIIGLPGDRVSCCDPEGRVIVNGQPIDEPYVVRNSPLDAPPAFDCRGRQFEEVVVAPGNMFVMGDHRLVSQDSRCQGQVPIENIIGRAFVIVWPNDRWTSLSAPETFADVPSPQAAAAGPPGVAPITEPALSLPFLLVLLPFPMTFGAVTARSRLFKSSQGRRLAA